MHTSSILMLLTWPALIVISWYIIRFAMNRYEQGQSKGEKMEK